MSESFSIDNTAFNGVTSEARQLSRLLDRQIRAYENVRNILNGIEQSNRNNISQASSDLERKIQDLQSKKESVDRFIASVAEFREDVNNTESNVASQFSSDNGVFPRLNSIGPVQNVVRAKNRSVVTLFTAFLDMGHAPGTGMFPGRPAFPSPPLNPTEESISLQMNEQFLAERQRRADDLARWEEEVARIREEEILADQRATDYIARWEEELARQREAEERARWEEEIAHQNQEEYIAAREIEDLARWEEEAARSMEDANRGDGRSFSTHPPIIPPMMPGVPPRPWPTDTEPEPWIRGWSRNASRPAPAAPPSPPPRVNPQPAPTTHFPLRPNPEPPPVVHHTPPPTQNPSPPVSAVTPTPRPPVSAVTPTPRPPVSAVTPTPRPTVSAIAPTPLAGNSGSWVGCHPAHQCRGGRSTIARDFWWGFDRYICDHETRKLVLEINSLGVGSTGAMTLAMLFGRKIPGTLSTVGTLYFAYYANALERANFAGGGVHISKTWIGPVIVRSQ